MQTPTRRAVLSASATTLCVGLAGCSGDDSGEETATAGTTPEETEGEAREIFPPDPFYVSNFTDSERTFDLTVVRDRDDAELISGRYRAGARQGVRFPSVGVTGQLYRITVAFEGYEPETREWDVTECSDETRHEEDQAASMYVREGEVGFAQNDCDNITVGTELEYISIDEAAVDA